MGQPILLDCTFYIVQTFSSWPCSIPLDVQSIPAICGKRHRCLLDVKRAALVTLHQPRTHQCKQANTSRQKQERTCNTSSRPFYAHWKVVTHDNNCFLAMRESLDLSITNNVSSTNAAYLLTKHINIIVWSGHRILTPFAIPSQCLN